jgi:glycosyltransferase involved in cell wall biosynthesis
MKEITNPRVLVVAPGHRGRGGIDSVVRLYQDTLMWNEMSCHMLSTYDDRNTRRKIFAAIKGYLSAPAALIHVDIVHVHLAGEISLLRKIPILVMAKVLRRRVIIHVHACSEESLFIKTPRWAWKFVLKNADRVIALSSSWERCIKLHASDAHVVVIPNPVRSFPLAATQRDNISPRILYVGKLEARKGYDTLIAAAAIVLNKFPRAEFWLAGHGELDAARRQAEHYGISSNVRLLGWVTGVELERIYEMVNIFCLPSHNEGVPMSMLEAMSHSLPVICTAVGGVPDVIENEYSGLLVEPGNAESVASGILRLLQEPKRAALIAEFGYRKVSEMCSIDIVATQISEIYRDLAKPTLGTLIGVDNDF